MTRPRRRRPRRRRLLAGLALAGLLGWLTWELWTWPDVATLARRAPATTAFVESYRAQQRDAGRDDRVERVWTPYDAISVHVKRAVVAAEDMNFFGHRGFDLFEVRQAFGRAVEGGELPRGASTLTQQLAKNLWLSPSRNPLRKVKEAILTWQLERTLSKRRILELYLNVVEFGPGLYGIGVASRRYFGKAPADLEEAEAAQLAATLPRPGTWHPGNPSRAYQRYVETIRRRMAKAEFLWKVI